MSIYKEIFGGNTGKPQVNGNRKGKNNERDLAKALSVWVGCEFNRVPSSGGLRWKNAEGITGDLVPEDKDFAFIIETKFYNSFEIKEKLRKNSLIYKFYRQVTEDVERLEAGTGIKKYPLVCARKNGMGKNWYVFFPDVFAPFLSEHKILFYTGEGIVGTDFVKLKKIRYKKLTDFILQVTK